MDDTSNKKNKVRILHLYHDLMNLYGDWGNAAVLARLLNARGSPAGVECRSVGDEVDFSVYDFVYIGSGTERSQRACMRDLARHAKALLERIDSGMHALATGNSHELFGRTITQAGGERYDALGLLDFSTIQLASRVTGDCVFKASEQAFVPDSQPPAGPGGSGQPLATLLPERLVGFINRAGCGQTGPVQRPFITETGPGARDPVTEDGTASPGRKGEEANSPGRKDEGANSPGCDGEGVVYKNLLGTYMTGPVLVRNPPLLKYFADRLCPESRGEGTGGDPFFDYQEKAYVMALSELTAFSRRQPK